MLSNAIKYFLYLGPDNAGEVGLQIAEEKVLTLPSEFDGDQSEIELIGDADDGEEGIFLQTFGGFRVYVTGEDYSALVGDAEEYLKSGAFDALTVAFSEVYPDLDKFGYTAGMLDRVSEVEISALTMDKLDTFREIAGGNDFDFFPPFGPIFEHPDLQVRYGRGPLTDLMGIFLYPFLTEDGIDRYDLANEQGIFRDSGPPNGWTHPEMHADMKDDVSLWSLPDVMWVQAKLFCVLMQQGYEKEASKAQGRIDATISKFQTMD